MNKSLKLFIFIFYSFFTGNITKPLYGNQLSRSVDLIITPHIGGGFFCEFGKVINSLIYYEQEDIRHVYVNWTNQFFPYKDDPNESGWDLYFEPIQINQNSVDMNKPVSKVGNAQVHELHDQLCVAPWLRYDDYLPYRKFVHEKINEFIHIKKHITDQVDSFYDAHMKGYTCIGIHIRYASAHVQESPGGHPSLATYCAEVDKLLNLHKNDHVKIFLASDSNAVITHFKNKYLDKLIYLNVPRAENKEDPGLIYENAAYGFAAMIFYRIHPQQNLYGSIVLFPYLNLTDP